MECGSACNSTCDEPIPICTQQCVPRCQCPYDTVWFNSENPDEDPVCRPASDCPGDCEGDYVWKECGSACERTCEEPFPACTRECVQGCECPGDSLLIGVFNGEPKCGTQDMCDVAYETTTGEIMGEGPHINSALEASSILCILHMFPLQ